MTETERTVLVTGKPTDGFTFYGPVTPNDPELERFTDMELSGQDWWYCPLSPLPIMPLTLDQVIDEATEMGLLDDKPTKEPTDMAAFITVYAYPGDGDPLMPATAWYYQGGPRWMAVVAEWEPETDWFVDSEPGDWPTPRTYPIDQRPPYGTLIYRDIEGNEVSEPVRTPAMREPRQTRRKTQDLFLAAQNVMNALALECLRDPAVPRDLAEKLNDNQQWLTGCDWAILGWDTGDPPPDAADQLGRIGPVDAAVMALYEQED
jgi:hypothetical protein